jgi:IS605 OrfB family transposase
MENGPTGTGRLVPNSKTFTYQTRIWVDTTQNDFLLATSSLLSKVERKLLFEHNNGNNILKLKSAFLKKYQITARQFNAIRINLQGKIASIEALREDYISDTKHKIKKTIKTIKYLTKLKNKTNFQANKLHQKKRLLVRLDDKLKRLIKDKKDNIIRICFGGKKLFKKQFHLEENGYDNHQQWQLDWRNVRNSQFYLIGSKDETMGNQSCIATVNDDDTINLRIRAPDYLQEQFGKFVTINNIKLHYGQQEILEAIGNNLRRNQLQKVSMRRIHGDKYQAFGQAINYRFVKDGKGWKLFITVDKQVNKINSYKELGAIGVDINISHLAVSETDRFGNIVNSFNVKFNTYGKSKEQAKAIIGDGVKVVVDYANNKQKPIILERLNFQQKKRDLEQTSAKRARLLSSFAYSTIISMLKSRAFRFGIETYQVNPAYSSLIGRVKFGRIYKISIHQAAAMVIARRFYGFSERLPRCCNNIPDNKGGRVTLSRLVQIAGRHVWHSWAKVLKELKAAHVEQYQKYRAPPSGILTGDMANTIPF